MIERYSRPEMAAIWSDRAKFDHWLRVEVAVCEAWAVQGAIPADALPEIRRAHLDLDRMRVIEEETGHDVIAFLRAVGESIGDASRFIHLGLTSSDVVDTALALQLGQAGEVLRHDLDRLEEAVTTQALAHRHTVMIGRTHGIHAEPITFGLKLLVWVDALRQCRRRLEAALDELRVGKLAGAVGTHANLPPSVEEHALALLGLRPLAVGTQVIGRDRHAYFLSVLAILASVLDNCATEIRHLQRTEVREAAEPFTQGQQGSSAMPHKRNPILCERVSGMARLLRGYAVTGLENVTLWHERDISHSSTERVILPDACLALDYMLDLLRGVVTGLRVDSKRMRRNLDVTGGLIFSQRVLLALIESGMDRQEAYRLVQGHALQAWDEGLSFHQRLAADPVIAEHLSTEALDRLFDVQYHLESIDEAYRRLGLPLE
jgi:adenylosuccinate lyase